MLSRKEAHREFRRLYHLEEKRRQQLLNRHEFEIDEQRQEFRRKRDELVKKYDFELQTMEQKQKIEIERESVILTNECSKKMKQIKIGLFYLLILYFSNEIYLDQEKELKQFREQIREQFKQIKREFDSPYTNTNNSMLLNNTGKFTCLLNQFLQRKKEYPTLRYRVLSGDRFERPIFSLQLLIVVALDRRPA